MHLFNYFDLFLASLYILIIIFLSKRHAKEKIKDNYLYKYYTRAIVFKICGALALTLIYLFYYKGGDTVDYMYTTTCLNNLIKQNLSRGLDILFSSKENGWVEYSYFNGGTGFPERHIFRDPKSFAVSRYISPIAFIAFNNFITTAVLVAWITFVGIWRLFLLLAKLYPLADKELTYAVLYIPSVLFWGSGIMKDTLTFSATCMAVVAFYGIFMERKNYIPHLVFLVVALYVLISIKPYILYSLVPGSLIWFSFKKIKSIKNVVVRFSLTPIMLVASLFGSSYMLGEMSESMGKFSVDNAVSSAQVIQQDLKRDQYGDNYFDIGEFDGSTSSMISKAPVAINAALFRPYLIEARNPVMILSALENTLLLFLTLSLIIKIGIIRLIRYVRADPYLLFALLFTIIFAFMVGLSTSNFGALVRYKIPLLPFFMSFLYICRMYHKMELAGVVLFQNRDN